MGYIPLHMGIYPFTWVYHMAQYPFTWVYHMAQYPFTWVLDMGYIPLHMVPPSRGTVPCDIPM